MHIHKDRFIYTHVDTCILITSCRYTRYSSGTPAMVACVDNRIAVVVDMHVIV